MVRSVHPHMLPFTSLFPSFSIVICINYFFTSETLSLQLQCLLCASLASHPGDPALCNTYCTQSEPATKGSFIQPTPF